MSEYTQAVCQDGAAILKDGQMMTIEEIIAHLRAGQNQAETIKRLSNIEESTYKLKAEAVKLFVDNLIGAFESGFTDSNCVSLAQLHRAMQTHIEDNYQVKVPHITEAWGNEVASECGFDVVNNRLRNPEQEVEIQNA